MNLIKAIQVLTDANVDFVIIGGWSAILHGSAYSTNDLDICFARTKENCKRLAEALTPFHPRLRDLPSNLPFVWDATTLANGTTFTLGTDLGGIDLLAEVSGLGTYEDVRKRAIQFPILGREVWTLDLPSLIQAKRAAGRTKDLQVLPELEGLLEATTSPRDPKSMTRNEVIRMLVLFSIADDYEEIDHLVETVARIGLECGFVVTHDHVVDAVLGLWEQGLARAYDLLQYQNGEPIVLPGPILRESIVTRTPYFWITPNGRQEIIRLAGCWPFDDEGKILPSWSL